MSGATRLKIVAFVVAGLWGRAGAATLPPSAADAPTADADARALAEADFRAGVHGEEEGEFAESLTHYRACVEAAPSSRWARSARSRIVWIGERAEGDFEPLARLQRVRRDPHAMADPNVIDALGQEAEAFPPGVVRSEARMVVAESWLRRGPRRADALAELRRVIADPSSNSGDTVFAAHELVVALLTDHRLTDAAAEVEARPFDPNLVAEVQRLVRRRAVRRAAVFELAALATWLMFWRFRKQRAAPRFRFSSKGVVAVAVLVGSLSIAAAAFILLDAFAPRYLGRLSL